MFWTDWGDRPAILRSSMDGSSLTLIITTDIRWPNGVAIDYNTNTIYWVDAYHNNLQRSDVNGLYRKTLIANTHTLLGFILEHPFDIKVKGGHIYWSDWQTEAVYRADIPELGTRSQRAQNLTKIVSAEEIIFGITIVDTETPRRGGN